MLPNEEELRITVVQSMQMGCPLSRAAVAEAGSCAEVQWGNSLLTESAKAQRGRSSRLQAVRLDEIARAGPIGSIMEATVASSRCRPANLYLQQQLSTCRSIDMQVDLLC